VDPGKLSTVHAISAASSLSFTTKSFNFANFNTLDCAQPANRSTSGAFFHSPSDPCLPLVIAPPGLHAVKALDPAWADCLFFGVMLDPPRPLVTVSELEITTATFDPTLSTPALPLAVAPNIAGSTTPPDRVLSRTASDGLLSTALIPSRTSSPERPQVLKSGIHAGSPAIDPHAFPERPKAPRLQTSVVGFDWDNAPEASEVVPKGGISLFSSHHQSVQSSAINPLVDSLPPDPIFNPLPNLPPAHESLHNISNEDIMVSSSHHRSAQSSATNSSFDSLPPDPILNPLPNLPPAHEITEDPMSSQSTSSISSTVISISRQLASRIRGTSTQDLAGELIAGQVPNPSAAALAQHLKSDSLLKDAPTSPSSTSSASITTRIARHTDFAASLIPRPPPHTTLSSVAQSAANSEVAKTSLAALAQEAADGTLTSSVEIQPVSPITSIMTQASTPRMIPTRAPSVTASEGIASHNSLESKSASNELTPFIAGTPTISRISTDSLSSTAKDPAPTVFESIVPLDRETSTTESSSMPPGKSLAGPSQSVVTDSEVRSSQSSIATATDASQTSARMFASNSESTTTSTSPGLTNSAESIVAVQITTAKISKFVVGQQTLTVEMDAVMLDGHTLGPGSPITLSSTEFSLGTSAFKVDSQTETFAQGQDATSALPAAGILAGLDQVGGSVVQPGTTNAVLALGDKMLTIEPTNIIVNEHTLRPGSAAIQESGITMSLGKSDLVIGSTTAKWIDPGPTTDPAAALISGLQHVGASIVSTESKAPVVAVGNATLTLNPSAIAVAGYTLKPGASPITVSGTLLPLGSSELVIGTKTESFPAPSSRTASADGLSLIAGLSQLNASLVSVDIVTGFIADGQSFTIASSKVIVAGHTLAQGDPAVTISGATVSVGSSAIVVGTHTEAFTEPGNSKTTRGGGSAATSATDAAPWSTPASLSAGLSSSASAAVAASSTESVAAGMALSKLLFTMVLGLIGGVILLSNS
jgi:hypothetical protein